MKAPIILLSRFSSTRLPGKALLLIKGLPLIEHIIKRFQIHFGNNWGLLATSVEKSDEAIYNFAISKGIDCFRGSLENVAKRFLDAATIINQKYVVRITGDSIFIDQNIIRKFTEIAVNGDYDLVSNRKSKTYPIGQTVEVIKVETFEKEYNHFSTPDHFEHVTSYFYEDDLMKCNIAHINNPLGAHRSISLAIDTLEDYQRACIVFDKLGDDIYNADYLMIENEYRKLF